ncbi:hypothetical protein JXO52_08350 [bacterium]|nr:hypothetical protein [bacterium]
MRVSAVNIMRGVLLSLLVTAAVAAGVDGDIHRSFSVSSGGLLEVEADLGSIQVVSGSRQNADIEIRFEQRRGSRSRFQDILSRIDVEFEQHGNNVYVKLDTGQKGLNFWNSFGKYVKVTFYVKVPEAFNLDLQTSGGSITVDDIEGKVEAKTSGGSLRFGTITGPVTGKTSGGSIALESCKGDADIHTSGGSISIGAVEGNVDATTSGGSISVDDVFGYIRAHTSGGSVNARIARQPERDCSLKTSGGTITVYMKRDIGVNVDASTSGGRVHTEFPVTVKGTVSKRSLHAKINDGGPELYLRTSGGSIYIKEM